MSEPPITVMTWNVQGARGLEVDAVAGFIRRCSPDVVLLQEIQRGQARRLAGRLGFGVAWRFKNLSWRTWSEGMAVLSPHPLSAVHRIVLRRGVLWNWKRRIALFATVAVDRGDGGASLGPGVGVVNVHLSAHDDAEARRSEARRVVAAAAGRIIGGDCNDVPGGAAPDVFEASGWVDAWAAANEHGDAGASGATNWTGGERTGRPPTQRLDYVWVPMGFDALAASVPVPSERFDEFASLSDHLPLVVSLAPSQHRQPHRQDGR